MAETGKKISRMSHFNKIFFDFDSTLIRMESLDELSRICGIEEKVHEISKKVQNGEIPFEKVYKKKVDLMAPSLAEIQKLIPLCVSSFVADTEVVMAALFTLKKDIYIVSSNFHTIVDPVAHVLGIAPDKIIANDMYFKPNGAYDHMNYDSPLCTTGGKALLLKSFIFDHDYTAFIGDAVTDLMTKNVVNQFIGFGGVEIREKVKKESEYFIEEKSLSAVLPIILTQEELKHLEVLGFHDLALRLR